MKSDQCLFQKPGISAVVYVDDILFFAKDSNIIDENIAALEKIFELTKTEANKDLFSYLGVEINRHKNNNGNEVIELLQPGLIDKIIMKIKQNGKSVKDAKTRNEHTPASTHPLHSDKQGEDYSEEELGCSYTTAIGLIMYLANTRPDILYAINEASRFTHCPKESHARAIV